MSSSRNDLPGMPAGRPRPFGVDSSRGRDLAIRMAALDAATERATTLLEDGLLEEAMVAWSRVALASESLLGPDHPWVFDAMRIAASTMNRLGRVDDANRILCEVAERVLQLEGLDSPRLAAIRRQIEVTTRALGSPVRSAG